MSVDVSICEIEVVLAYLETDEVTLFHDASDSRCAAAHEGVNDDVFRIKTADHPTHDINGHLARMNLAVLVLADVLHLVDFPPVVQHAALVTFCDTLGDSLVRRVLVWLVHHREVGLDAEVGDVPMLSRSVRVIHPCHDSLRELPYMEGELVECFGVVNHHDGIALRYLLQPLEVFILALVVLVFVVVIAHVERRVGHYAILVVCRQFRHTF